MRPAGEHISMTLSSTASSALTSASHQLDLAAEGIRKAAAPAPETVREATGEASDELDLSTAAVNLLQAKTSFRVALRLAQTADEMARHTLDLLA